MPFSQEMIDLVHANLPNKINKPICRSCNLWHGSLECVFSDSVAKDNFVVGMRNLINSSENLTVRRMIGLQENSSTAVTLVADSEVIALFLQETGLNLEKPPITEGDKRVAALYLAIFTKEIQQIRAVLETLVVGEIVQTLSPAVSGSEMIDLKVRRAGILTPIEFERALNDPVFFVDFLNLVSQFYEYGSVIKFYVLSKKTETAIVLLDARAKDKEKREHNITALMDVAIRCRDEKILDALLDAQKNKQSTSLTTLITIIEFATEFGIWEIMKDLLRDLQAALVIPETEPKTEPKGAIKFSADLLVSLSWALGVAMVQNDVEIAVLLLKMGVRVNASHYESLPSDRRVPNPRIVFDSSTNQYVFKLDGPDTPRGKICKILTALFNFSHADFDSRDEREVKTAVLDYFVEIFKAGSFGEQLGIVNDIDNTPAKRAWFDALKNIVQAFNQQMIDQAKKSPKSQGASSEISVVSQFLAPIIAQLTSWCSPLVKAAESGQWKKVQTLLNEPNPSEAQENYQFVLSEAVRTKQDGALILTLLSLGASTDQSFKATLPRQLVLQYQGGEAPKLFFSKVEEESLAAESQSAEGSSLNNTLVPYKFFDIVHNLFNAPKQDFSGGSQNTFAKLQASILKIMRDYIGLTDDTDQKVAGFILLKLANMFEKFSDSTEGTLQALLVEQYHLFVMELLKYDLSRLNGSVQKAANDVIQYAYNFLIKYYVKNNKPQSALALLDAKKKSDPSEQAFVHILMPVAIEEKNGSMIDTLLDKDNVTPGSRTQMKIMAYAAEWNQWEIVNELLNNINNDTFRSWEAKNRYLPSVLMSAMCVNRVEVAVQLLKKGIRVSSDCSYVINSTITNQAIVYDERGSNRSSPYSFCLDSPSTPRGRICRLLNVLFNYRSNNYYLNEIEQTQQYVLTYFLELFHTGSFGKQLGIGNEIENAADKRSLIDRLQVKLTEMKTQISRARRLSADDVNFGNLLDQVISQLASWRSPLIKAAESGQWETVKTLLNEPNPSEAEENYHFVLSEALRTQQAGALIMSLVSLLGATHNAFEAKLSDQLVLQHQRIARRSQFFFKPMPVAVKVEKEGEEKREEVQIKNAVISDKFFKVVHNIINKPSESFPDDSRAGFIELRANVLEIMAQYTVFLMTSTDQALAYFKLYSLMDVFEKYKNCKDEILKEFVAAQYQYLVVKDALAPSEEEYNAEKEKSAPWLDCLA